jgi:hypothetical protein
VDVGLSVLEPVLRAACSTGGQRRLSSLAAMKIRDFEVHMRVICPSLLIWVAACSSPAPGPGRGAWTADVLTDPVVGLTAQRLADGGVRLAQEHTPLALRVDASGAAEIELGDGPISLRATAWGHASRLQPALEGAPELAPCPAMAPDCTAHLRVARGPGVEEWWVGSPLGLEHGWTFAEAPAGVGPLQIELAVRGAQVTVDADGRGAALHAGEQVVRYARVQAWDAAGRTLAAKLEATSAGLRLQVDTTGAVWPVVVDPWVGLGVPWWGALTPGPEYAQETSTTSLGDVNGDGFDDVALSWGPVEASGGVWVFAGGASGPARSPTWTVRSPLMGTEEGDYDAFGEELTALGDVNADGYADFAVLADYGYKVWLYLGSAGGPTASGSIQAAFDVTVIAGAGDVNGDGRDDLLVADPSFRISNVARGRVQLFLGAAGGLSTTAAWTADGPATPSDFGAALAGVGDVNGDGRDDVVVGAPRYANGQTEEGQAVLYYGSPGGLLALPTWAVEGNQVGARLGAAVAAAGDVNRDGRADVAVGLPSWDGGLTDEGRVQVYHGGTAGLAVAASWFTEGEVLGRKLGHSLAGQGDVDGDSYGDLAIGWDGTGGGGVRLHRGGAAGLEAVAVWTVIPDGAWLQSLPITMPEETDVYDTDVDYDTYQELDTSPGSPDTGPQPPPAPPWTPFMTRRGFAASLSLWGDVNNDGRSDLAIGAAWVDIGFGASFVHLGHAIDADGDGVGAGIDPDDASSLRCGDRDGDTCDDCAQTRTPRVDADGADQDLDGWCDRGDTDDDADTVPDARDPAPLDPARCGVDSDGDTCDDCAVLRLPSAAQDGADLDGDGRCDQGDPDDDGDLVLDGSDPAPLDPARCGDSDADTCDDCALARRRAPGDDGPDLDGDGRCDAGDTDLDGDGLSDNTDPDDDGDTRADGQDPAPRDPLRCGLDTDADGCDDCAGLGRPNTLRDGPDRDGDGVCEPRDTTDNRYMPQRTSSPWLAEGAAASARIGGALAVGDVNGDGVPDLVSGAPRSSRVDLWYGSPTGLGGLAWSDTSISGTDFGARVALCDVDADGVDDLLVASPGALHDNQLFAGDVSLWLGGAGGPGAMPDAVRGGAVQYEYFGKSMSCGDLDGDDHADLVVSASGYVHWFPGGPAGLAEAPAWSLRADASPQARVEVLVPGDVDGDGFGDLVVARPDAAGGGQIVLFEGGAGGPSSVARQALVGAAGTGWGNALAGGDLDADGHADVVVGEPFAASNAGQVQVLFGAPWGLVRTPAVAGSSNHRLGEAVAIAGDLDHDGRLDLALGAPQATNGQTAEGVVQLHTVTEAGVEPRLQLIELNESNANFGTAVAGIDTNDDGAPEIAAGAPGHDRIGSADAGGVWLFFPVTPACTDIDRDLLCDSSDPDRDEDGLADAVDDDDDGDTVPDTSDPAPLDALRCGDTDADSCDDCARRRVPRPLDDGADLDADGLCDAGDGDDDGDFVIDSFDTAPSDPRRCADTDSDGCDDCSSGALDPSADGADLDRDGLCDGGDLDDDGDLVPDGLDSQPRDPRRCADDDADTCEDCASGSYAPDRDGPDADADGVCDAGEVVVVTPTLDVQGTCPGTIGLRVRGATPGGQLAFITANSLGASTIPAGPCAGTPTGIRGAITLRTLTRADAAGTKIVQVPAGAPVCGAPIQVLDLSSCALTPATRLP